MEPFVGLAQALLRAGDRNGAAEALLLGYAIAPTDPKILEGMQILGVTPPPAAPPPPEPVEVPRTPTRDQVIAAMRPLDEALAGCAPAFSGQVSFRVQVLGETGEVARARIISGDVEHEAERACMEAVLQSAIFTPFRQRRFTFDYPFELNTGG